VPIDLATFVPIVAAVVGHVPHRGAHHGRWWTWPQTGLSLFVLATSTVLLARQSPSA
jgi:hypothetical protein